MKINIKWITFFIITLGIIMPFSDYFVAIEAFFLLIPFGAVFLFSFVLFIINLIIYKRNTFSKRSSLIVFVIPLFLLPQLGSVFLVSKIQRIRSENIISKIENNIESPNYIDTTFGLKFLKTENENKYIIEYKRGFL